MSWAMKRSSCPASTTPHTSPEAWLGLRISLPDIQIPKDGISRVPHLSKCQEDQGHGESYNGFRWLQLDGSKSKQNGADLWLQARLHKLWQPLSSARPRKIIARAKRRAEVLQEQRLQPRQSNCIQCQVACQPQQFRVQTSEPSQPALNPPR